MMKYKTTLFFVLLLSASFLFSGCSMKKINDRRAMFLYQDGMKLSSQGDFDGALEKFNASIQISEKNGFVHGIAHNYNEIGNIYTYKKNYGIAREYFQKALDIYQENNMRPEVSKSLDNIAKTYMRQGDYQQAFKGYETLLSWDMESKNLLGAGITNFNMGLICEKYMTDNNKAKKFYQDALDIFLSLNREKEAEEAKKSIERISF